MDSPLATVTAWSYGLAAVGYAAFALQLGFGWRGGLRGLALLAAVALSAGWGLLVLAYAWLGSPLLLAGAALADVLRVGGWFAFLLLLVKRPDGDASPESGTQQPSWLMPLAAAIVFTGLLGQALMVLRIGALGDPVRLALFASLASAVMGLVLVEQLYRNVPEQARWGILPLCLGLTGAFMFDLYFFAEALLFSRLDADVWSVRGFVYALALPLIAVTAARDRDGTFRIALSRRMVFGSTGLVMVGLYLLFIAAAGYYVRQFGGTWGRALQVALLFAALLLLGALALSGSMRAKLRVLVSKHFFSYRYDYREEWLRFTQALSSNDTSSDTEQHVVRGLANMVESPGGGLWLRDTTGQRYVQRGRWNMRIPDDATEPVDGPLARFLLTSGWVINLEELRSSPERYAGLTVPPWVPEVPGAWLIVPLATGSDLIGFVILATARTQVDVDWEVNDLLKTAGRQAASFLGQTQATEALLEARKFDAFNRMSAFVVHDLKNIVSQLSLMVKNAERHRDNPEFQQDMLMTVEHSVERMKQLMMQLREGTTPVDAPQGVDLADVVRHIQRAKSGQVPVPELQLEEGVAAKGHKDRLERVIGHIVQNALDATPKEGRVWIRLARENGQATVEIGDTGHGMTPEFVRDRLFKPFQTTKQTGMGIGAYESLQYVQELGGRVAVASTPDVGTRVRLSLPLFDPRAVPDQQNRRAAA
jgi:putative PEP-CTERM system histidine kinase